MGVDWLPLGCPLPTCKMLKFAASSPVTYPPRVNLFVVHEMSAVSAELGIVPEKAGPLFGFVMVHVWLAVGAAEPGTKQTSAAGALDGLHVFGTMVTA